MSNVKLKQNINKLGDIIENLNKETIPNLQEFTHARLEAMANELDEKEEEYNKAVQVREAQIAALDVDFAERKRQLQVSFDLDQRANEEKVLTSLQSKYGFADISLEDLSALNDKVTNAKKDSDAAVAIATNSVTKSLNQKHALANKDSEIAAAQSTARISQLMERVDFLQEQLDKADDAMEAQRNVTISVANATGGNQPSIHLNK